MVLPLAHADPAEVVRARAASHVITALVFLNRFSTLFVRAILTVGHNPCHVLRLGIIFRFPLYCCLAINWLVTRFTAVNTEQGSAFTLNGVLCYRVFTFVDAVLAAEFGTPFDGFIVVSKRLA